MPSARIEMPAPGTMVHVRELLRYPGVHTPVPASQSSPTSAIPWAQIRRFGKLRLYGTRAQLTVAELVDGRQVQALHKEQSTDVVRLLARRLKGVWADQGIRWEA